MTPFFDQNNVTLYNGDCREVLRSLPDQSVNCCVTSPPYYGLRDYGCDGQIGLEKTPAEYVAEMVAVMREVRRVLADDGTLWLNVGDSYSGAGPSGASYQSETTKRRTNVVKDGNFSVSKTLATRGLTYAEKKPIPAPGLKPKDLIGIPWMLAFALRDDGWYLRQDIIWHKPNPMPESVTDRCTKAHEYIFLLSKSERYYYDGESIAEPMAEYEMRRRLRERANGHKATYALARDGMTGLSDQSAGGAIRNAARRGELAVGGERNRRSVWTVTTKPFKAAHFATFPPDLIAPCIRAGCPGPGKRCDCDEVILTPTGDGGDGGDPSRMTGRAGFNRPRRDDEGRRPITRREQRGYAEQLKVSPHRAVMAIEASAAFDHYIRTDGSGARPIPPDLLQKWTSRGWLISPSPCSHQIEPAGIVLDPFFGAGTTGLVCQQQHVRCIGIELNKDYCGIAARRLAQGVLPFSEPSLEGAQS